MSRILNVASARFRAIVVIPSVWLGIEWLMGYLRPLDASPGLQLPAWSKPPGSSRSPPALSCS